MIFTETEAANLSTREVLLAQPFESPITMRRAGVTVAETSFVMGLASSAIILTGVAVGVWEKTRSNRFPGNGVEMIKVGAFITAAAAGGVQIGMTLEDTAKHVQRVKSRAKYSRVSLRPPFEKIARDTVQATKVEEARRILHEGTPADIVDFANRNVADEAHEAAQRLQNRQIDPPEHPAA